jgi:hypothetical protein
MLNRLKGKTKQPDGSGPIGEWAAEWLLPVVWFVLAIVLLGKALWF